MTLKKLLKLPRSPIVGISARERIRELGKTKNAILKEKKIKKDSAELIFSSPATYRNDLYKIKIQVKKNEIRVHCSCSAFLMQGFQYRCTSVDVSITPENREDKRWRRYHGNAIFCKHLDLLFRNSENLKKISKIYESFEEK